MPPSDNLSKLDALRSKVAHHLEVIYPNAQIEVLCTDLLVAMGIDEPLLIKPHRNLWDEQDVVLITYGDTFSSDNLPLRTLKYFLNEYLKNIISVVHILPFYPYSSDDGFSVIDYSTVNESLGSWQDIENIAGDYKLMADLVINHVSARSLWFENFKRGLSPGADYFITLPPDSDISDVVRPRTSPLLSPIETATGEQHVWCTFSPDQVDMNFANPNVLVEFAKIIALYLDKGVTWFRLDAVAFLWKELGTPCIHLPQTHELIKLIRLLIESRNDQAVVITETNVPNRENLTYFGNANQAHLIYNFSLPPLLVNALVSEDCRHLKTWLMSMPPAQQGTCYLNFIASHDGIGVRPLEGLLSDREIDDLLDCMRAFGGEVTYREKLGSAQPYEINIALVNALGGTMTGGLDQHQLSRYLCAHAIMLALEGIPAFYIHSLFGTPNDHERVKHTGRLRSINRHIWNLQALEDRLQSSNSHEAIISAALIRLIEIRKQQPAFHPNATQFTLHLGTKIFGFWRQSADRKQSIFAINNVTSAAQTISLSDLNLIDLEKWSDLITGLEVNDIRDELTLAPYQAMWLTNTCPANRLNTPGPTIK